MTVLDQQASEKAALRARFRVLRGAFAKDAHAAVSSAIVAHVLALPEASEARTVLTFWPLLSRGELDVRPLAEALSERGVVVGLPVVVPGPTPRLVVRRFTTEADLVAGPWGLREPRADASEIAPESIDVVIVPALALGRDGTRLGYGGGYYDAFLPTTHALRVGVVPDACLADSLPAETHDARLNAVVTETGLLRMAPPRP